MATPLRVLLARTTNPYFNLATEDWIFHDMEPDCKVLFLWRNEKSIIVGRGQNVWSECDLDKVEADGVHVVRRHSGGGAVYQDLGNTCFTFMSSKETGRTTKELYARNNTILLSALESLGVRAEASGRNDLVVELENQKYKISGSAFKESKDRCFHHGTMLMKVDLGRLSSYLTPDSQKLKAKGIKSVQSRVMNLTQLVPEMDHDLFCKALIQAFFEHYENEVELEYLDDAALSEIDSLGKYHEQLKSWDWIYGKTPNFQHTLKNRFSWGGCEVFLNTDKGHITEAKVFTDSLWPEMLQEASSFLQKQPYSKSGVAQAYQKHLEADSSQAESLQEFYDWLGAHL